MKIGNFIQQTGGFKAFVPEQFPPAKSMDLSSSAERIHTKASFMLGKLDGITNLLPDLDFFIFMYVRKEAALSSQIEGTKATMINAIEAETELTADLPSDVSDILHYIEAMNYGLKKLEEIPLSLRLIKEVHKVLLTGARVDHFADPGNFRTSQNWIGGGSPATARFVPPPPSEVMRAMGDIELFMHKDNEISTLVKAALIHAQFETVHPFLDGNGRTGRLLMTFYLCQQGLLERPVLYLSEYFKRNREAYFDLLNGYHNKGEVEPWIKFFLEGVADVAEKAIATSKSINSLREEDIVKVSALGGKRVKSALKLLQNLYTLPIVDAKKVEQWTGLSRPSANALIKEFVRLGILEQRDKKEVYRRRFEYKRYLSMFTSE
ncbi:MAG: hypothetical protein A2669_00525 [Candidatus Yanofskybacteria bacterium RIFCSPHIGHO2_01_FULL_48_25b]|uniref:Fido domain-containing protein n=1 Tax=Candidatus Yanofskybacteria bacterium RIFCSPHIGHO2_01_FULL_48_25b TaxID=1802672 RepID=A0A1F8F276_9BACT|nr:MAG: hypothetical protein A2669_00525 [Candidatus Yanofskybacteria bacterium RIFCSPHIGHO2_01_FULL_48_25b]